ncbi:MAG: WYL domain-containing protein [Firmicutes bacterium]|nr:WYL domain-containing protein [Bacillota bacterium]
MHKKTKSKPVSPPGSRSTFWRLCRLHYAIKSGDCPNLAQLAAGLGVSPRTVARYLRRLREMYGPLIYDQARGGYRYDGDYGLPRVKLTAGEVAVLLIGHRLLAELTGTPLATAARQVMEKLPFLLVEEISAEISFGKETFYGLSRGRGNDDRSARFFDLLAEAIAHRRTVRMVYYTRSRDATTEREVDPYHLRLEAGAWFMIGYCHLRRDLRIFSLDRIKELALTEKIFERASEFTIRQYLGLNRGNEREAEHVVRVAFDPVQARWIRERIWHDTQKLTDTPDGGVILEIRVKSLEPIKRWVLGFGRRARVLSPPELVRMVREEVEGMVRQMTGGRREKSLGKTTVFDGES